MCQESERLEQKEAFVGTLANFVSRFVVCFSFVLLIEQQIDQLDQEIAGLLRQHQDAVERLAEVPGLGVDSAQQITAEAGAKAAAFASAKNLSSWVGHARERKRARA
jgi:transposase